MDVVETVRKADEYMSMNQPYLAFQTYLGVVKYYRRNKKKMQVTKDVLTAYNNAVVLGLYLADTRGKLIKTRDLALEFVKVAKKSDDSEMYAIACFHAGVAHNALGEYKKSVKHLEEALVIFEVLGDNVGVMLTCKNLAEAYEGLRLKSKAEICRMRAEALSKKLGKEGKESLFEIDKLFRKWKNIPWMISR